jgi:two-component system, OmpR family, alkaline phosphatase synthesis response regulator PhoP
MPKTILVCDDDPGILDVTTLVLTEQGYNVVALPTSADIFKTIAQVMPDVVLLDLWMPEVSGEEITKKLKSKVKTRKIPVIIISASRDTEKIAKLAGANDFLCKPFNITELEEKVAQFV